MPKETVATRITTACDNCAFRRVKCDGKQPACGLCVELTLPCVFLREVRKRGPKCGHVEKLHSRIRELEAKLHEIQEMQTKHADLEVGVVSTSPTTATTTTATTSLYLDATSLSDSVLGSARGGFAVSGNGISTSFPLPAVSTGMYPMGNIDLMSQIQHLPLAPSETFTAPQLPVTTTPMLLSFDMPALSLDWSTTFYQHPTNTLHPTASPPPHDEIHMDLIHRYFDYFLAQIPIFPKEEFIDTVHEQSPLLLNAMYALALTQPTLPDQDTFHAGDQYFKRATSILDDYLEHATYSVIAALVLLSYYSGCCGLGEKAYLYAGMAIRMGQTMGLDRAITPEKAAIMTEKEIQLQKRMWAVLYVLDRSASLVQTDIPYTIRDEDCDISIPDLRYVFILPDLTSGTPVAPLAGSAYLHQPSSDMNKVPVMREFEPNGYIKQEHDMDHDTKGCDMGSTVDNRQHALMPRVYNKNFSHSLRLTKILSRIKEYDRTLRGTTSKPDHFDMDMDRVLLDSQLENWMSGQAPWVQKISDTYGTDVLSTCPPHWIIAHRQIMYHYARLLLHGSRLFELQRLPAADMLKDASTLACLDAAHQISVILSRFNRFNPGFAYVGWLFALGLFRAGIVFILSIRIGLTNQFCESDPVQLLDMHIRALKQIGRFWVLAKHLANSLEIWRDSDRMIVAAHVASLRRSEF
ncbi:hypothetical protein BSLG_007947 [Batrachochytrium salamandrivorans]|nr:hypothetical protein BSLG_007947 [Batrachochytrium salamandrivorans]